MSVERIDSETTELDPLLEAIRHTRGYDFRQIDRDLRNQVFRLFTGSMHPQGCLCLGNAESSDYSDVREVFKPIANHERLYRQKSAASRAIAAEAATA